MSCYPLFKIQGHQLALALLFDYTDDAEVALQWYQLFKETVIAGLPRELHRTWKIGAPEIESFLRSQGWTAPVSSAAQEGLAQEGLAEDGLVVMSDEEMAFAGYYGGRARCRILLSGRAGESVVVAVDLPAAPGTGRV